jgi:hypothetical protein
MFFTHVSNPAHQPMSMSFSWDFFTAAGSTLDWTVQNVITLLARRGRQS